MLRVSLLISVLMLTACGQKGALYFAEPAPTPAPATSPDDSTD